MGVKRIKAVLFTEHETIFRQLGFKCTKRDELGAHYELEI
jgi:hypothetical protein